MLNPECRKAHILVIEDSYLSAQSVCDMVSEQSYQPVGHVDTEVQFVCENDINLHGVASFQICEQLAKKGIPFVFLTGYDRIYSVPPQLRRNPGCRNQWTSGNSGLHLQGS